MQDIYTILCNEIAGTCKKGGLMKKRKKVIPPKTLFFSLGYCLNVKSNFLLLPVISKHTTSQKVLEYLSSHL